jgi:hypothetical protein
MPNLHNGTKVIDLRNKEIKIPSLNWPVKIVVAPVTSDDEVIKPNEISVELRLNNSLFKMADEMEYDLIITNITNKPISLPCETDFAKVVGNYKNSPPPGLEEIIIQIYDKEEYLKTRDDLIVICLLGSNLAVSSKTVLEPNESIIIKGNKRFAMSDLLNNQSDGSLSVRAQVNVTRYDNSLYYYVVSKPFSLKLQK